MDIELDHLHGITTFLQILGVQTDGLSLTPLINKLVAIKHEGEAVDQIMDFFNKNGVPIDESRKRNLVRKLFPLQFLMSLTACFMGHSFIVGSRGASQLGGIF